MYISQIGNFRLPTVFHKVSEGFPKGFHLLQHTDCRVSYEKWGFPRGFHFLQHTDCWNKMETLRKPFFFIGNPRTPDGNASETLIFHRKPCNPRFGEYNTSSFQGFKGFLWNNMGFRTFVTWIAFIPIQKQGFPKCLNRVCPSLSKKQRFPKNFNHASTGWPANGCFAAVPYKFRVLYIMSALTGATRSAVLCPRFGPKMSWGVSFQGPPRHQERKRYVNVKKKLVGS